MVEIDRTKVFLYEYYHSGSWWMVEIHATDADDAHARIQKLPLAKPVGELVAKIPAFAGGGILARMFCWLRNAWAFRNAAG